MAAEANSPPSVPATPPFVEEEAQKHTVDDSSARFYQNLALSLTRELAALRRSGMVSKASTGDASKAVSHACEKRMTKEELAAYRPPLYQRHSRTSSTSSSTHNEKDSEELARDESAAEVAMEAARLFDQLLHPSGGSERLPLNRPPKNSTSSRSIVSAEVSLGGEEEEKGRETSERRRRAASGSSSASLSSLASNEQYVVMDSLPQQLARAMLVQRMGGGHQSAAQNQGEGSSVDIEELRSQRRVSSLRRNNAFISELTAVWSGAPARVGMGSSRVQQRPRPVRHEDGVRVEQLVDDFPSPQAYLLDTSQEVEILLRSQIVQSFLSSDRRPVLENHLRHRLQNIESGGQRPVAPQRRRQRPAPAFPQGIREEGPEEEGPVHVGFDAVRRNYRAPSSDGVIRELLSAVQELRLSVQTLTSSLNVIDRTSHAAFEGVLEVQRSIAQDIAPRLNEIQSQSQSQFANDKPAKLVTAARIGDPVQTGRRGREAVPSSARTGGDLPFPRSIYAQEEESTENGEEEKHSMCVVCMEKESNTVFYKCGHLCTCSLCALALKTSNPVCPMCRANIVDIVRVFDK
uniref:RING-type domain-containing protein n=1 Tax=Palpitomonas bilix TaxID=652834 RepID=A0A7S3D1V9_9EUKA|mmetsp:Transcript_18798/g.47676  ORF Transcript_18798/g.47676 Transcript_18798/m.47676 type:complete len:576 (+) Transcript_18798:179-1906(+)